MKTFAFKLFCGTLITICLTGCSQETEKDCKALLDQSPYFFTHPLEENQDSVNRDYTILKECGNLDSIDGVIFQRPLLAQLIIMGRNPEYDNSYITYQNLTVLISDFKKNEKKLYRVLREGTIARWETDQKLITLQNFETFRSDLKNSGLSETEIEQFNSFLKAKNKSWTYKQAFDAFFRSRQGMGINKVLEFPGLGRLEELLSDGKTKNKNCLVYFSGWASVNSRKMEKQELVKPEIKQLIKNHFVYAVAYVDERHKEPGKTESIGQEYSRLQQEKFKSSSQPTFYILSSEGKILASWTYTDGPDSFREFLEKGKKK